MCHVLPNDAFSIRRSLLTALHIRRLARKSKTDVIHGHGITVLPALSLAGMLTGLPLVLTLHNIFTASRVQTLILKLLCKRVNLIAVSDAILKSAADLGGMSAQRIYNGVAVESGVVSKGDARKALGLPPDSALVVSVSRLSPEKGLADLAAAAKQILGDVVIVGDGPEREALSTCDAIKLVGYVDKPWLWYCAADVVAVPSITEGLGLSAIEALSSGCPVVATDVGGLPEVIADDSLGTCVSAGDVTALASAINHHLTIGRGSATAEEKRRAYVADKFSINGMLIQTNALYGRILGR
jgi:glycosyltransferase involved in cell wall biosynthesis